MSVESELKQVIDGFTGSVLGLFEITGHYMATFEQGVYACAIAKPTKRLRVALGVDREILVVASNFKDQQQRSIKFVRREIDNSDGRFEPTIAIFVHNDADGNLKLKNWGRGQSIAILPLFRPELTENPEDLERLLCTELYSHDPFDVTGPVSDDSNFFGRREEAIDLARKLQKNQIRSCLGIRKIGKTSIINRIVKEITTNHDCICVMVDCSRDDVWSSNAASLVAAIEASIKEADRNIEKYSSINVKDSKCSLADACRNLQAAIAASIFPVVVIFDEIDYITPGSPTAKHWIHEFNAFWRNFRAVYQEISRLTKNISVLIGGVSTYWFTVESINGVENAALSFVPEEYLSPMQQGATVAMLKRLSKSAGLRFDEQTYDMVAKTSGNMPFWARKCCSWINDQIPVHERPMEVGIKATAPMIEGFAEDEGAAIAGVALKHLFRVHPGTEEAAFDCALGQSDKVDRSMLRVLHNYGVVDKKGTVSALMIKNALESIQQHGSQSSGGSPAQFDPLDEWAEELAAMGKRRNVLERKLRELVLNWIRQDSVSNRNKLSTKERILAVIPAKQHGKFAGMATDMVIGKLMWLQLVELITREWDVFGRVFGDKRRFLDACDIVNERFDAHAKEADHADFALYRRAVAQIEDSINRL